MFVAEGLMNDLTYTFADMPYRTYQYSLGYNNYIRASAPRYRYQFRWQVTELSLADVA